MGLLDTLKSVGSSLLEDELDMGPIYRRPNLGSVIGRMAQQQYIDKVRREQMEQAQQQAQAQMVQAQQMAQAQQQQTQAQQQQAQPTAEAASDGLYDAQLEKLIDIALSDGELTEKERNVLFKRAEAQGIDRDEFEMVLEARLAEKKSTIAPKPAPAAPQAPRQEMRKCPACGAHYQAFKTRCPECGQEYTNVAANHSVQHLFDMLNEVENENSGQGAMSTLKEFFLEDDTKERKKKLIIQNYPIPTTKADILEFLALAVPLARKPGFFDADDSDFYLVWRAKCEQIIIKARFAMKDDPTTLAEINAYGKQIGIK